jgi:hypothetical protein
MNTHQLLDQHPSVQALNIANNAVDGAKVATHRRNINARPFTTASAVLAAHKGGLKDEKNKRVTVVRNENNISAAAVAAAADRSEKFKVTATTKLASVKGLPSKSVPLPPLVPSAPTAAAARDDDDKPKGSARSLVSSAPSSFDASSSHARSYSDYSCSCCHPRKTLSSKCSYSSAAVNSKHSTAPSAFSSTSVPASAYENMSSISERMAKMRGDKHVTVQSHAGGGKGDRDSKAPSALTGSMTSSKLRDLESELEQERKQRKHTEEELASIKARQELLLSKLSDKDREDVRKLVAAQHASAAGRPGSSASAARK